jgi:polysaccharide export outer membrane protein
LQNIVPKKPFLTSRALERTIESRAENCCFMPWVARRPFIALAAILLTGGLAGCAHFLAPPEEIAARDSAPIATASLSWGQPVVIAAPPLPADPDGPYLLDTGDKLRIFVYGNPNLSRLYTVDHEGQVAVPLIGNVTARGRTTRGLARAIASRLGAQYVKDPHVTVDIAQNRPFFILGEVRNAGQYPFVSGLTVQAAVAIAGGYADRANERRVQITRRVNGFIEKMDVPPDCVVQPGDTIYVYERWL